MKKAKKFDCVEMKARIQEKLRKDYAGMSEEEARRIQMEKVLSNPVLGPFVKALRERAASRPR